MSLRESLSRVFSPTRLAESSPRPDTTERGDNGISFSTVRQTALRQLAELDHNYEWRGANRWKICDRMRKTDPKIFGLRKAQTLPLLRTEAQITGSEDEAKVEFVRQALLEDFPWRAFLQTAATHVDYGFAAFAVNWRVDDDGKYRIDELRHLPCNSIRTENILVKRGAIDSILQTPMSGGEYPVPGEYLLWFAHDKEGDDFTGRPILRAMHKPWFTKERLEILLPVLVEKMGGVPVFTELAPLSASERAKIDEMGEGFVLGERQYIRKPQDVDFALVESHVKIDDILGAIRYFDSELTAVCQAQYLDLGVNQAGSRAYGTTLADMFSDAVQAQASYIEDVLNARDGLIHQLIAYNFPNDDDLPKLRFSAVQHTDVAALTTAVERLVRSGMPLDGAVWDHIRSMLNFPEAETTTSTTVMPGTQTPADDTTPPAEETPDETGTRAAECGCGHRHVKLAERRPPRGIECYVALDELSATFDDARDAVRQATQATRDKLVSELAGRAMTAARKGTLNNFAAGAPPMIDKLTNEIRAVLEEAYAAGRKQVDDELTRQREGQPVTEIVEEHAAAPGQILAAEPKKAKPPTVAPMEAEDIAEQAETAARRIASETLLAAAAAASRIKTVPLSEAELEEAIRRDSDASALRMAAFVTDLLRAGRADEARDRYQEIEQAWYSAILDDAACEVCSELDGQETADLDEAADWTPNPGCQGGDRCRCVTIYEYRTEAK